MERLQAAIEKARQQREERQPARRTPGKPGTSGDAHIQTGPWDEIPMMEWSLATLRKNRVVAAQAGPETSHYDILRTKVVQMMRENKWKRLAVTSPDKGAGKSTTCCNLVASLSRQNDRRSILFDLDMRRPAIASIFGHKGEHGVAAVLEDRVPFHEQAVRINENAAVSMNYRPERNPSELLLRDRTAKVLEEIERVYEPDLVIFDMPPMLLTDDTLAFLKNVDCAMLVAGAESTTIDQIDLCEKEIADQTNVLGVVLNKCRHMDDGYGYEYY